MGEEPSYVLVVEDKSRMKNPILMLITRTNNRSSIYTLFDFEID